MFDLFEGRPNPEERAISERALEVFREHRAQLGDKCSLVICNDPYNQGRQRAGVFSGWVSFPSGVCFSVDIVRRHSDFVIESFEPLSWEMIWSEVISDTERYYRLGRSPVYYEP
jgi:hypothetical protein